MKSHKIDYAVLGDEMQVLRIEIDPGESVIAESGSMMFMENGIELQPIVGDASDSEMNLMDKFLKNNSRMVSGENLFMNLFTNRGIVKKEIAFVAPCQGKIIPLDLSEYGNHIICNKKSFLCGAKGVSIGVEFVKKIGAALLGSEGFFLQKLEGDGMAFVHASGTVIKRELMPGKTIIIDLECLIAFTQDITYDVEFVKGITSALLGGEGFFTTTVTGPGTVWMQSHPISRLAVRLEQEMPERRNR